MNYIQIGLPLLVYLSTVTAQHRMQHQQRPGQQQQQRPGQAPAPGQRQAGAPGQASQAGQRVAGRPPSYQNNQKQPGRQPYGQSGQQYNPYQQPESGQAGVAEQLQQQIYDVEEQLAVDEQRIGELQNELDGVPQEAGEAMFAAIQAHEEVEEKYRGGADGMFYTSYLTLFMMLTFGLLII